MVATYNFGSVYRQIVGIPMGTYCALLLEICFCLVMRETSCCLGQTIVKLILLKLKLHLQIFR